MSYPSALDDPDAQNMVLRPQLREMLSAILSEHKDAVDIVFFSGQASPDRVRRAISACLDSRSLAAHGRGYGPDRREYPALSQRS